MSAQDERRTLTRYEIVSFNLTDDWWAWFRDDDGDNCCKLAAVGIAKAFTEHYRNGTLLHSEYSHDAMIGIELDRYGDMYIVNEAGNFLQLLKTGFMPTK